jgi:FkbM family methyltransferase
MTRKILSNLASILNKVVKSREIPGSSLKDVKLSEVENKPEVAELSGVIIPINEDIFSPTIISSIRSEEYEQQEADKLPAIIKEGDRVLEIGAGIGYISSLVARDSRVSAIRVYEANPKLIPLILNIHKINNINNVEVFNGILSDDNINSKSKFYLREDFWASSLVKDPWEYEAVIDVPNVGFSHEINTFRPTLIICDIEGGELDLFVNGDLGSVERVYVEVHQEVLGGQGMKQLFDAMSEKGFHYDQWHSCGSVVLFSRIEEKL